MIVGGTLVLTIGTIGTQAAHTGGTKALALTGISGLVAGAFVNVMPNDANWDSAMKITNAWVTGAGSMSIMVLNSGASASANTGRTCGWVQT